MRYLIERRFILPMTVLFISAIMVFTGFLSGVAWAGLAGTIVSGYFGLAGWTSSAELRSGTTLGALRSANDETKS